MKQINAIGKVCPMPVIMTKNILREIESGVVEVLVDNSTSVENVEKYAKELGYPFSTEKNETFWSIKIEKVNESKPVEVKKEENTVVVIGSDEFGVGDSALSKTLMKGFIYTLTELDVLPSTLIFYNKGVLLAVNDGESYEDLKTLESHGVEILSCGACTNFYGVTEKIKVGTITNMLNIVTKQMNATRIIKP